MGNSDPSAMPDDNGFFGEYGGQIIPPELKAIMDEINDAYDEIKQTPAFREELQDLYTHYVGRPSPLFHARRLTRQVGGANIFLNHTYSALERPVHPGDRLAVFPDDMQLLYKWYFEKQEE